MSAGAERIPNWLDHRAHDRPDRPALVIGQQEVSYRELHARACATANRLRRIGVRRGTRVGVRLPNGLEFAELMHALTRLGAVLVPLHTRLTEAELEHQLAGAEAELFVSDEEWSARMAGRNPARSCVARDLVCDDRPPARSSFPPAEPLDLSADHCIIHTSGSTGGPRGVRLTCGNHWWSAVGSALHLGLREDDRWLACIPFCHVGGLSILLRSVIYGTTAIIHDGFDPARVNESIDRHRVTLISVVPTMLRRMIAERGAGRFPPTLRCILVGGGPVPAPLLEQCAAGGLPVAPSYGLTEAASQVSTLRPGDERRKLGSAGTPLPPTEIRIDGEDREGPILVRGPTITPGYIGESTPATDGEGWFHTGDIGRIDDDGFLHVLGRNDEVIVSGGENIYPPEVEAALESHPAVAEACVFGVPDEEWGVVVAACVRPAGGSRPDEAELRDHVRSRLAGFKAPRRIRFVKDFPRTAAGKIRRREMLTQEQ